EPGIESSDESAKQSGERSAERGHGKEERGEQQQEQEELDADEREEEVPHVDWLLSGVVEQGAGRAPTEREPEDDQRGADPTQRAGHRAAGVELPGLRGLPGVEPAPQERAPIELGARGQAAVARLELRRFQVDVPGELRLEVD